MRKLAFLAVVAGIVLMMSCSSGGSGTITAVVVSCSLTNLQSGTTSQCVATVTGTGSFNSSVTWKTTAGTISTAGLFTPPAVTTPTTVTVTATSTQDTSKTGTIVITVTPPGPTITAVTVSCSPTSVQSLQTSQCAATVTGTNNFSSAVNWTASSGSVDSNGVFTAPVVATNAQVTVTATSVQDSTKSGSASIFVQPSGTISSVTVTCALPTILSNQDSQCTSVVTGTGNFSSAVVWTAGPGTISASGLYIAPTVSTATTATVTATSAQDGTKLGTAAITINPIAAGNNVLPVTVDSGPANFYVNGAFATVTICVPGTATCQTIDHLLVDTGSNGVRLLASGTAGGQLTLALPQQVASDGHPLHECFQKAAGYTWGPVAVADVQLGGEQASNIPVQVIGEAGESAVPTACSSGTTDESNLQTLGANGILGVGLFPQDCGSRCAPGQPVTNVYFSCPSTSACNEIAVSLTSQVLNPVPFVAGDNNGVLLSLPAVTPPGTTTISGSLILGIGTQANNAVGTAVAYTTDANGDFTVTYNGTSYPGSYISSGSNAFYFLNTNTVPQLPSCGSRAANFYCPASTQTLTATNVGTNSVSNAVTFNVDNAINLFTNDPTFAVYPNLGGPSGPLPLVFDWGLPFFYGRNVFTAIQGASTPLGTGPYWAY